LSFAGRVSIVTGGGGALGRAYALLLASKGCAVVVNDIGVPLLGNSTNKSAAQTVVDEIVRAGGKAVANYDNVLDGEKIVECAITNFGRIDIVINNAGILRDVSFAKMTNDQWKSIQDVHVNGAFAVTRAAWPYMLKQNYGRIINTSSAAGLYGHYGQVNYSTAKLGLVGFTLALSCEGKKHNIYSNVVAPVAGSRMTATVFPPELVESLKPSFVAPVVIYLASEHCVTNGHIYEVGGGWVARLRWQRSAGHVFPRSSITPESVRDFWHQINTFDGDATTPSTAEESFISIFDSLHQSSL
jgi:NAD(P)-dependent dehydrogenase (short-subunit alcohol dehydrogenase family)